MPWLPTTSTSGGKSNRARSATDRPDTTATCTPGAAAIFAIDAEHPGGQRGMVGVADDRREHAVDVEADQQRA